MDCMKHKFLLFAIGFLTFFTPKDTSAQVLVNENFDGSVFPPLGWSNSVFNGSQNLSGGPVFQWFRMFSGSSSPYYWDIINNPGYYSNSVLPTGISAHSGSGMAWANYYNYTNSTNYGLLITPQLNFTGTGSTTLSFWFYQSIYSFSTPNAPMTVYYNNAQTLTGATSIATLYPVITTGGAGWHQFSYTLPAGFVSGDYIIFKGQNNVGFTSTSYPTDMHIDDVTITHHPPCSGTPTGTIVSGSPCPGKSFDIYFSDTAATGLTYNWEESPNNVSWYSIASTPLLTTSITGPTFFRITVTCGTNHDTVSTLVNTAPFYMCYCADSFGGSHVSNIGNVSISSVPANVNILNNGSPSPVLNNSTASNNYSNFTSTVAAPLLYRDSTYSFSISQIQNSGTWNQSPVNVYIDLNRNGVFELSERILLDSTLSAANPGVSKNYQIPATASIGLTGMRVLMIPNTGNPAAVPLDPCLPNTTGEIEDYLVNISYSPCNGPANAGIATSSDTMLCPGDATGHYSFTLTDTSYERHAINLTRVWQVSYDTGVTWSNVPASQNVDAITLQFLGASWYRVKMICTNSHDTSYSTIAKIHNDSSYRCYCYSTATGGYAFDSTDIGAFRIGNYFFSPITPVNNSHLNNVNAINPRFSYTHSQILDLYADSTYPLMVYDVMKTPTGAPAKITLFIDYNNDIQYSSLASDSERVWTTFASDTNFFDTTFFHTKVNVVTGVPTGMRLIINNNTNPNIPSDEACGPYTSGETLDFVVKFHPRYEYVAGISQNIQDLSLYPNPTGGRFKFGFNTSAGIKNLSVRISNITGQQVLVRNFENISNSFSSELDLSSQARGIYFVEFVADGERIIKKLSLN